MANLSQASLRHANLALVARTVLAADSPPSRADVAVVTSLTRSTVSRLVDELVAGGILEEVESVVGGPGRPGRPATPLRALTGRFAALGLQVGVGHLTVRLVDLTGTVLAERLQTADLAGSRPGSTLRRLRTMAGRVLESAPLGCHVVGAGLALPGIVYLSGEVGIGGAVVVDGDVMTGRHGWAGEIGHVCVDPDGPPCRCGSTGCLEQYAGRLAMLDAAGLDASTTPSELAARARDGDEKARAATRSAARALGVALAGVVNVLDIPTVVLGGHLAQVGDLLTPEVEEILGRRVLSGRWVRPRVVIASDDPAPGAMGAALLALDGLVRDPVEVLGH